MEKSFLQRVKEFADNITPDKNQNEAIMIIARDSRVTASIDGNIDDLGNMLYATAKSNPALAELLEDVVDKLNETETDNDRD